MIDKPTVAIVDDHPWVRAIVAELLQPMFTVVAQAEDGDAALRVIGDCCPQLVILDINMPKVNGFEVARQLIERASPAKVVFISLEADKETIDEARRCGHGYVFKPRLEPDLVTALDAAMRGEFFASDFGG